MISWFVHGWSHNIKNARNQLLLIYFHQFMAWCYNLDDLVSKGGTWTKFIRYYLSYRLLFLYFYDDFRVTCFVFFFWMTSYKRKKLIYNQNNWQINWFFSWFCLFVFLFCSKEGKKEKKNKNKPVCSFIFILNWKTDYTLVNWFYKR